MEIYDKIILWLIDNHLWPFPSAKRKFIHEHLCLHWLKFMIISSAKRKTIHEHLWLHWLKFMTIPSAKRKFIYEHLLLHWWSFLTKKARSAKPFMTIYDFIDDHFWLKKSAERKTNISLISFLTRKNHSSQEFMSNFKSRTKRLPRIQVTVSHNQRLRIPSMQIPQ